MNNLSNEQLKQIIETDHVQCGDAYSMARELLAYREAQGKAVACEFGESNGDGSYSVVYGRYPIPSHIKVSSDWPIKLFYAAPQLPAVPDVWITYHPDTEDEAFIAHSESGSESCARRIAKEIGGYVVPVYHGDPSYE